MPELPEVETTCRAVAALTVGRDISNIVVHNAKLRYPVDEQLPHNLLHQRIKGVTRRAKYLMLDVENGTVIIHLGMSGSLRVVPKDTELRKHDHIEITLDDADSLRYHDPRRFGSWLWTTDDPFKHPLLISCGVEPLGITTDKLAERLYKLSRGKTRSIKQHIMDNRVVVGVGNIYACEALFHSGISPKRQVGRVSELRYHRLAASIQRTLAQAIEQGGTTLRDFAQPNGNPGYFKQVLAVYGRAGQSCGQCGVAIRRFEQGQRSTFYCVGCQH